MIENRTGDLEISRLTLEPTEPRILLVTEVAVNLCMWRDAYVCDTSACLHRSCPLAKIYKRIFAISQYRPQLERSKEFKRAFKLLQRSRKCLLFPLLINTRVRTQTFCGSSEGVPTYHTEYRYVFSVPFGAIFAKYCEQLFSSGKEKESTLRVTQLLCRGL